MKFTPFFFDCNLGFAGKVDDPARWRELARSTKYGIRELLAAKVAPQGKVDELPAGYHYGAPGVRTGKVPSFGFRREHVGTMTLGTWAREQGMELWKMALIDPRVWLHEVKVKLADLDRRLAKQAMLRRMRRRGP